MENSMGKSDWPFPHHFIPNAKFQPFRLWAKLWAKPILKANFGPKLGQLWGKLQANFGLT